MLVIGMLVLFLVGCGGVFYFLRKKDKRAALKPALVSGLALVLMATLGANKPLELSVSAATFDTDNHGLATISGQTSPDAALTLAGQTLTLKEDGSFSHDVQLVGDEEQEFELVSTRNKKSLSEKVTVTASAGFKKQLALAKEKEIAAEKARLAKEKADRELAAAETAVVLAERELNEDNYQAAVKLVQALDTDQSDFNKRLETVKENLAKEKAQLAEAETILATAEKDPTEANYESAKSALAALPIQQKDFDKRLASVNTAIVVQKEQAAAQRAKEAKAAKEEQEALAAQAQQEEQAQMTVLVTPTGRKYHNHVCGRGNYYEDSLANALARGLEPCKKCF